MRYLGLTVDQYIKSKSDIFLKIIASAAQQACLNYIFTIRQAPCHYLPDSTLRLITSFWSAHLLGGSQPAIRTRLRCAPPNVLRHSAVINGPAEIIWEETQGPHM